jgi:cell division protein FtsI (penicillin-binding protein 3)
MAPATRALDPKALAARRARFRRARVMRLAVLMFAGAGAVVHRAYELQVLQSPTLRAMAEEQYLKNIALSPKRGTIYDRNGAELAISVDVDSVYANPRRLRELGADLAEVAARLASLLGLDPGPVAERLATERHFVWVKRRVSPKEGKAVAALGIPGIELTAESRRFYPNRELASHVLGFANIDGKGIEGLELDLDEKLRGSSELVPAIRDRRGFVVFSEQLLDDRAAQGDDVVLTLDKTLQHVAERELELTVRTFEAKGGSVVVLDPLSGEILAMANFPTYNPNEPAGAHPSHRRNRAITDRFEPGSTLKPFTIAGALAAGVISPSQRIDCEDGKLRVAQYTIHDTHRWEALTPSEILAYSSNIGTAKAGMQLGRARLYRTLRDFGFGAKTGLGFTGETAGILRHYKRWYDMDAATIAFGQGMSATALQLAAGTAAIANRGRLLRPQLVKRIEDARGEIVQEALPHLERQVVPPRIASMVADMLVAVTGPGGTGVEAAIDGHLVAGKTGTAQKADYVRGGYAEGKWVSSFVGFAPARKPRLVAAVIIDEPLIAHHGGTVAAPAFRRIVEAGLRHLGVVATAPVEAQLASARRGNKKRAEPSAVAQTADPEPVSEEAAAAAEPLADGERRVPDLIGYGARQALIKVREADLSLALRGSGVVVLQRPGGGEVAPSGSAIEVLLERPARDARPKTIARETAPADPSPAANGSKLAQAMVGGRDG